MAVLTFVLTTRDRPLLLRGAIDSVLSQTVADIELVVVDDGSDPPVVLDVDDERVRLLRSEGVGVCAARNLGLAAADGGYVAFIDDDDEVTSDMAEVSLSAIESSELPAPVAALSAVRLISDDGVEQGVRLPLTTTKGDRYPLVSAPGRSQLTHATLVAPVEVCRNIGGFDPELRSSVHSDFFMRLSGACSIQGVDQITYVARLHEGPRVSTSFVNSAASHRRFAVRYRDELTNRERERYLSIAAWLYLRGDDTGEARRTAWEAFSSQPDRRSAKVLLASLAGARSYRWARARRSS